MLFDLKGRRRRIVQVTYLTLALLMGGGLVFFGIGGDVSGGLFDAFSDRNQGSSGQELVERQRDRAEERRRRNPRDAEALKSLVRANYNLASSQSATTEFPPEAKDELAAAARAWERYLALDPRQLDISLAGLMLQAYGPGALERYDKARDVARLIAERDETPESYLRLVQFASLAGDTRTADLAGQKAIDLAPRDQRRAVREQVEQLKAAQALQELQEQQQQQGGGGG
jgi:hypothetical protein